MKSVSRIYLCSLLFLVLFLPKLKAQQGLKFELIDVNEGLSHGSVNSILRDSYGYVWFGTLSGLNQYDGYSVKTFTYNPRDSSSLNSTEVLEIFEGPERKIWVQTTGGLNIYDHRTQSFDRNVQNHLKNYGLPDIDVEFIVREKDNIYWFASVSSGVFRYNCLDGSSLHYSNSVGDHIIASNNIADLEIDPSDNVWLLYDDGLLERIDPQSLKIIERYEEFREELGGSNESMQVTIDAAGDLWIFAPNSSLGAFYFNPKKRKLTKINESSPNLRLNTNLVTAVVDVEEGQIWIGTDHGGINIIDKEAWTISYHLSQPEVPNSLVHNSIYSMYKDSEGITWIGTYKNGVNYYHKSLKRFDLHKHFSSVPNSLPFDDVNRFVEDSKGNLWIGTNGGGLLYFDRRKNTYKQYLSNPNDPNSLSSNVIVSLSLSSNGDLWVGTYLGGLDKFDGKKFQHFKNDPSDSKSISGNNIWEMFTDSQGETWISTLNGGLDRYNSETGGFSHIYLSELTTDTTLTANYIYEIAEDSNGDIWVAGGGGIDIIDRETEKVNINKPQELNALIDNTVTSLFKDYQGRMWIGTQEGLYVYGSNGEMKMFTIADGLPHNAILTIVEDDKHNLWFGTPNGVSNLIFNDLQEGNLSVDFINYDETDGLQGKVFNENAALKLRSGEIALGGANGFNIFHPENLSPNRRVPGIVFTDFQLFNQGMAVGEQYKGRTILTSSLNSIDELVLKHNENVFSIEFAALNFLHPQKNEYKYMLEGFDEEWRVADQTRRVTYTNLDAGDYIFKVIASNNDGVWNEEGIALNLRVKPPFYLTSWAYILYGLIGLIALYITRRMIIAKARMRYSIEQERREARQMHELDLLKIRFLTNISHEFRTPLSLILAPLDKLISSSDNDQKKQFLMIKRNARRLLNLVNQLLDFRKLEIDTIELNKSRGDIIKFVEESVRSFADLSENKGVNLSFSSDREELYTSFDMDKMEKVLFNLLSNAFKFTPENGRVEVGLRCLHLEEAAEPHKMLELKVCDTGIGIPKEKQSKIFDRFYRNDVPGSVVNQGSGIGLSITREFVRIHGGSISLESEEGKGSCFTVTLPVTELQSSRQVEAHNKAEYLSAINLQESDEVDFETNTEAPVLLLVEDNEDFRFYLKDNLKEHFKIVDAKNGIEGWQKCLSVLPDLVVSDLMMPEMNGIELCQKVKEDSRTSHIPFILLTADVKDESKLKGINKGADDYITKPFNYEILLSRINNLIVRHKTMQETYSRRISVETSQAEITSLSDKLIQDAIRIVEENISDSNFSVELLSRELGISRAHLYKKMVSLTGLTPVEFIRKIRLQRAAQFLEKSQLTVAEVAFKVGFNNRKYFSKYFKQEYKMLPSNFASHQNS